MSSSYRSDRLGLSHWDPYAVHRAGCLELYYCNMVEWFYYYYYKCQDFSDAIATVAGALYKVYQ